MFISERDIGKYFNGNKRTIIWGKDGMKLANYQESKLHYFIRNKKIKDIETMSDTWLDKFNDYMRLYDIFGDEEYKTIADKIKCDFIEQRWIPVDNKYLKLYGLTIQ